MDLALQHLPFVSPEWEEGLREYTTSESHKAIADAAVALFQSVPKERCVALIQEYWTPVLVTTEAKAPSGGGIHYTWKRIVDHQEPSALVVLDLIRISELYKRRDHIYKYDEPTYGCDEDGVRIQYRISPCYACFTVEPLVGNLPKHGNWNPALRDPKCMRPVFAYMDK